jgi:4-hydroxy-2,2'-bipyrrole-5-carbaldehyde O-methyltransferase
MSFKPYIQLYRNRQLFALTAIAALLKPFYRIAFLAGARESGLLQILSGKQVPFEELAAGYCRDAKAREALAAWLQLGVRLGQLQMGTNGYSLKGLAKKLADPGNDAAMAMVEEVARLHYKLIADTPAKLRRGELWSMSDQDGELVARSSRILEAFQIEAIDRCFPAAGPVRLLEVGCGSGVYIRHAAVRNPTLTALGLELQPAVAEAARGNIATWGLSERVWIDAGDIRSRTPDGLFDVVTLYNNIYYFPAGERVALLRHLRSFVKPGGMLLATTCCQGGSVGVEVLNLWGAATAGGGPLPQVSEFVSQLREAGFAEAEAIHLSPGESFYAFKSAAGPNVAYRLQCHRVMEQDASPSHR